MVWQQTLWRTLVLALTKPVGRCFFLIFFLGLVFPLYFQLSCHMKTIAHTKHARYGHIPAWPLARLLSSWKPSLSRTRWWCSWRRISEKDSAPGSAYQQNQWESTQARVQPHPPGPIRLFSLFSFPREFGVKPAVLQFPYTTSLRDP